MGLFRLAVRFAAALAIGLGILSIDLAAPARAQTPAPQRAEIEKIVREYLMANPEVLRDAMAELEKREKAKEEAGRAQAVAEQRPQIFNSPHQVVLGNPEGKVTLVEFFDYNCTYCKKTLDDLAQLIKENKDLRLVLKDFPILSPGSVEASHVAIGLRAQFSGDKYWQYHMRLLASRTPVAKAQALTIAKDMGADMTRLAKDMEGPEVTASLQEVAHIADSLNLTGTPSFILGDDVIVGAVGYDELKIKIDNVRRCGRALCG